MPKFVTVTAPKERMFPVNPSDGSDPSGGLLYVTHECVCRVKWSLETRRGLRDGDLVLVKLEETIDKATGDASYRVVPRKTVETTMPDPKDPKKTVPTKVEIDWTAEEAAADQPLANGDRVVIVENPEPATRVDDDFDSKLAKVRGDVGASPAPADAVIANTDASIAPIANTADKGE